MEERLDYIRRKLKGNRVYYSSYNPGSPYMYDVEDAQEDMAWLVSEIERLRRALPEGPASAAR